MANLGIFYSNLATVGLIIVLGFILGRTKFMSAETNKHLINILLAVAWPCAIFAAFPQEFDQARLSEFLFGLLGGVVVLTAMLVLSRLIFNKKIFKTAMSYEGQFAFIFNNASFLGYPLVMATFGQKAMLTYCGFILIFNLVLFSYGVFLFERKVTKRLVKDVVYNPCIIAVLLGTAFFVFSLKLPTFVNASIGYLGALMTPLSLICIGYMLSRARFKKLFKRWKLFIVALLQLLLGPVVTYFVLLALGVPAEVRSVLVLLQALPTATSLGLFAEKYGGDAVESSELVAISTLMSVITLPIMILLLIA
ncbi:MAG: AEC family transporter [Candidatus Nomurabacteria bacterium]|jgi:predicted permease|nr:AEC family transporter [Candidatus Nomurabacteria bacterium]